MLDREKMLEICSRFTLNENDQESEKVVIPEPYIPYIPDDWNGILILAEAQNLGKKSGEYIAKLDTLEKRKLRLYPVEKKGAAQDLNDIGVEPWDDGHLKVALLAIHPSINLSQAAVGNAVPWSRKEKGANLSPTPALKNRAKEFWSEIFKFLDAEIADGIGLRSIIASGKPAAEIMEKAGKKDNCLELRSASPNYLNRIQGMFDSEELLTRYPEVEDAYNQWKRSSSYRPHSDKLKASVIFYACHAVSVFRAKFVVKDKQKIKELLIEHREQIKKFGVISIALFGSAVRGELSLKSDIDVLVDLESHTFDSFMGLSLLLEDLLSRKVDLVIKDSIKPRLKEKILAEAEYVEGI